MSLPNIHAIISDRGVFIVTSICLLVSIERTGGFWGKEAVKFGIAYWTLSISLNIIITVLIVARLILRRKRMRSALGDEHGHMYTSISAMLIESAALYSVWGLVFLITYAKNSAFNNILLPALGQVQVSYSGAVYIHLTLKF